MGNQNELQGQLSPQESALASDFLGMTAFTLALYGGDEIHLPISLYGTYSVQWYGEPKECSIRRVMLEIEGQPPLDITRALSGKVLLALESEVEHDNVSNEFPEARR